MLFGKTNNLSHGCLWDMIITFHQKNHISTERKRSSLIFILTWCYLFSRRRERVVVMMVHVVGERFHRKGKNIIFISWGAPIEMVLAFYFTYKILVYLLVDIGIFDIAIMPLPSYCFSRTYAQISTNLN